MSVADVIYRFHDRYLQRHGHEISVEQGLALQSILNCRTYVMGGHRYACDCGQLHFSWHSCNHRLCPVCGRSDTAEWVSGKLAELLPVDHYMVTFTLPAPFRLVLAYAPKAFCKAFFDACAEAIRDVLGQKRHFGSAEVGFFGMLQTWKQDLDLHPHIHFIVPGVALGIDGKIKLPKRKGWLAKGDVFASRLKTHLLKRMKKEGRLTRDQLEALWAIEWNCDVKNFGSGENAFKYLGAYVFKGPICDSRILAVGEDIVTIATKDRESGERRTVPMDGVEFVRRYLKHALPPRIHRLRYFGFLHGKSRIKRESVRGQLREIEGSVSQSVSTENAVSKERRKPVIRCPNCGAAMTRLGKSARAPPQEKRIPEIWKRRFPRPA